ncbi:LAFE_0E00848g1_1 [Lachancea fermentati]|uniref:LAFE_0E00848g1_1 n=1 Tax=Lachancea fermentati TaxID=4955 RepID=A0A1G4MCR1_LACFM|nr:LAFE_0E00848g1_1 [Lachancea fermentati]
MIERVSRDWFYKLASDLQEERVRATIGLIEELSEIKNESKEWEYVLNRLIKGLASSRNGARLGFSLCLTEVVSLALEKKFLGSIDDYMDLLQGALFREAVKNGKEERGLLFGKMFGFQALLNEPLFSKIFKSESNLLNVGFTMKFVDSLIQTALQKNWIREPCFYTIYQALEKLSPFFDSWEPIVGILQLLDKRGLTLTNEGLAVYIYFIHVCDHTRTIIAESDSLEKLSVTPAWKYNDPLTKGNLPTIAGVLKDSSPVDDTGLKQKGTWNSRLHFVWDLILQVLIRGLEEQPTHISKKRKKSKKEKGRYIEFPDFWKFVIDESFFSDKSSSERKYHGLLIAEKAFDLVPDHLIQVVVSKNLLRCLINQASDADRNLHKIAQKSLNSIVKACQKQPSRTIAFASSLLFGESGSINFDKITKTKTINSLINNKGLTESNISALVNMLVAKAMSDNDIKTRTFVLDTLLHVVRGHKIDSDESWINPLLKCLICLGFFKTCDSVAKESEDNEPLSGLELVARDRLFSILAELFSANDKLSGYASWPHVALDILGEKRESLRLLNSMDEEIKEIVERGLLQHKIISSKLANSPTAQLRGLELLFSVTLLLVYSGDTESVLVLEDLMSLVDSLNHSEENTTLVGLTEILLSFASQKKALLKKLSLQVWELFCGDVSLIELNVLFGVLTARENKEGFAALFEADNNDEESATEDVNELDLEEVSEETEVSQSEESDYSDDNVEKIDKEATSALARALNLPDTIFDEKGEVKIEDLNSSEDDEDVLSETSLDDEKMMELDGQLSEIFKRRKEALSAISTGNKRKQEVQESRENVIAFKHRVVDMIEIYVGNLDNFLKRSSGSHLNLMINFISTLSPLISCLRITLDRALAEKVSKLIKNRICKPRWKSFELSVTEEIHSQVMSMLTEIHEMLLVSKGGQFQSLYFAACSSASLFLSKLIVDMSTDDNGYDQLIDLYTKTLKSWLLEGKFGVSIFLDFMNWLDSKKQNRHKALEK